MIKLIKISLFVIYTLLIIVGCNSQQKYDECKLKAESVINDEFSKKFNGYKPIDTILKSENLTPFTDFECRINAMIMMIVKKNMANALSNKIKAKHDFDNCSNEQYAEYRKEYLSKEKLYNMVYLMYKDKKETLRYKVNDVNTSICVGWQAIHTFSYNENGETKQGRYIMLLNDRITWIVEAYDMNSDNYKEVNNAIKEALNEI